MRRLARAGSAAVLGAALAAQGPGSRPATLTLAGEVRDENGTPVVCATVALWSPFAMKQLRRVQTDGSGAYVLAGIPAEEPSWLRLDAPGCCRLVRELRPFELDGLAGVAMLKLRSGSAVTGCVRDVDGRPFANVAVAAFSGDGCWSEATTDANGRYALTVVPGARLAAYAPGCWLATAALGHEDGRGPDFVLAPDDGRAVTLRLQPSLVERLRGKCAVRLGCWGQGPLPSVLEWQRLGDDGTLAVRGLRGSRLAARLVCADPALAFDTVLVSLPTAYGTTVELASMRQEEREHVGRLLSEDGEPIPRVWLHLQLADRSVRRVETAADGTFRCLLPVTHLTPSVALESPRWLLVRKELPELRARRACVVQGIVMDQAGNAIPRASVWCGRGTAHEVRRDEPPWRTADDGTFTLPAQAPGVAPLSIVAATDDFLGAKQDIDVSEPGRRAVVVNVAKPAELGGRLVAADGKPRAGVVVRLVLVRRAVGTVFRTEIAHAQTDAAGAYRFGRLLPGTYGLVVEGMAPPPRMAPHVELELGAGQALRVDDLQVDPPR